jgi:hypothetical protein
VDDHLVAKAHCFAVAGPRCRLVWPTPIAIHDDNRSSRTVALFSRAPYPLQVRFRSGSRPPLPVGAHLLHRPQQVLSRQDSCEQPLAPCRSWSAAGVWLRQGKRLGGLHPFPSPKIDGGPRPAASAPMPVCNSDLAAPQPAAIRLRKSIATPPLRRGKNPCPCVCWISRLSCLRRRLDGGGRSRHRRGSSALVARRTSRSARAGLRRVHTRPRGRAASIRATTSRRAASSGNWRSGDRMLAKHRM